MEFSVTPKMLACSSKSLSIQCGERETDRQAAITVLHTNMFIHKHAALCTQELQREGRPLRNCGHLCELGWGVNHEFVGW